MSIKTGEQDYESFARVQYNPMSANFKKTNPVFSNWESDEQAIMINRLQKENYQLKQN